MRRKRSLIQIYLVSMIALAAVPVAINGAIWMATEYDSFTEQTENLRRTFVESRTELLRREVNKAVEYIDYKRSQLNRRLYQELRQEVAVALALIGNIHKEFAASETPGEMRARVRSTIEPLRFHQQKGFFFALSGDGESVLAPLHPDSRERLSRQDILQSFTRQIQKATRENNQDFLEFRFTEQAAAGSLVQRNISFVYYFKPLDLYVGASVYLRDEIARIQQEVIDRLAAVPYDPDSSVLFVTDARGKQLVNPYNPDMVGRLLPGIPELVDILRGNENSDAGKLVEMEWTRQGTSRKSQAVSFVTLHEDWNWLLGAGFFLDEYFALMERERGELEQRVMRHTLFISAIAVALMIIATLVARRLATLNAQGFHSFQEFFAAASKKSSHINVQELPFAEFEELARHANYMVDTRSETERALKLSERRFQLALDASQSHLWDLDMKNDVIVVGDGFYKNLGYPAPLEGAFLQRFGLMFHPNDFATWREVLNSADALASGISIEFRVRDNAGNYHWVLSRGDIVESSSEGQPLRAMGIMSDITERKRMEEELVAARIAAEDANHAKSQFLSSASHELRTPLNGVLGYVQLLQRQKSMPEESQGYLDAIENCGQHLLNLINDVLDLAKVESGTVSIELNSTNLRDLLSSVGDIVRQRAESKHLKYEHRVSENVPELARTDEVKLRQILVNLLGNAVKFTDKGSVTLEVDCDADKEVLLFSVMDTGHGIPDDQIKDIFEPFRRINEHDGKGTGLGLPICQRLIGAMGGELTVRSQFGKGSTFGFDIPLLPEGAPEEDLRRHEPVKLTGTAETSFIEGLRVVVADDNDDNRNVLKGMIEEVADVVCEAADGTEVLECLREHPAHLVLMDYRMPEMDGMECTRLIKADDSLRHTVVFMVTASAGPDTESLARDAGCDAFISKPVQVGELLELMADYFGDARGRDNGEAPAQHEPMASQGYEGEPLPREQREALQELLSLGDIAAMNEFCDEWESSAYSGYVKYARFLLEKFDFHGLNKLLSEP